MDAIQLYSSMLDQLNKAIITMTSPEWDVKVQAATAEQRRNALAELLHVQHARLVLGNTVLQEIAGKLKQNEKDLQDGTKAVQVALDNLANVESVLKVVSSFIGVLSRIVPLF